MKRIIATFLALLIATNALWTSFGCGSARSVSNLAPDENTGPQKGVVLYINDHLGNAHLITDPEGNVLREESRYPYGLDWRVDGSDVTTADYVYTGKEYDAETGLVYFGGRYYSPEMGRWITPDPAFLEDPTLPAKRPFENNLYSYVKGNPVKYIDPDGSIAWDITIDIGFFAYSVYQFAKEPNRNNGINLALDTAGLFPVVPSLGAIRRVGSHLDEVAEFLKPMVKCEDFGKFGQYTALWRHDSKAIARFEPAVDEIKGLVGFNISYLNRGGFPKGSGGTMLAEAIKQATKQSDLFFKPEYIKFEHVINERTLNEILTGTPIEKTLLGNTMSNTVEALGGELTSMELKATKIGDEMRYDIIGNMKYKYIE